MQFQKKVFHKDSEILKKICLGFSFRNLDFSPHTFSEKTCLNFSIYLEILSGIYLEISLENPPNVSPTVSSGISPGVALDLIL